MVDGVKATNAAKELAEEEGVSLAQVNATGADGQVTKSDVEEHLASVGAPGDAPAGASAGSSEPEVQFYVEFNPEHPELRLGNVPNIHVAGRDFKPGANHPNNIVTKTDWEETYKGARFPGSDLPLLKRGGVL